MPEKNQSDDDREIQKKSKTLRIRIRWAIGSATAVLIFVGAFFQAWLPIWDLLDPLLNKNQKDAIEIQSKVQKLKELSDLAQRISDETPDLMMNYYSNYTYASIFPTKDILENKARNIKLILEILPTTSEPFSASMRVIESIVDNDRPQLSETRFLGNDILLPGDNTVIDLDFDKQKPVVVDIGSYLNRSMSGGSLLGFIPGNDLGIARVKEPVAVDILGDKSLLSLPLNTSISKSGDGVLENMRRAIQLKIVFFISSRGNRIVKIYDLIIGYSQVISEARYGVVFVDSLTKPTFRYVFSNGGYYRVRITPRDRDKVVSLAADKRINTEGAKYTRVSFGDESRVNYNLLDGLEYSLWEKPNDKLFINEFVRP